jgi:hypothetical protein
MKTKYGWLYWLNMFLVQWFFVRIIRTDDKDGNTLGYGIMGPVLPMRGWRSPYIGWLYYHEIYNVRKELQP